MPRYRHLLLASSLTLPLLSGCLTAGVVGELSDRFEPLEYPRVRASHLEEDIRVAEVSYSNHRQSRRVTYRLPPVAPGKPVPRRAILEHVPEALYGESILGWCFTALATPFTLALDTVLFTCQPYLYMKFFFRWPVS
jgi:hypothetical protein